MINNFSWDDTTCGGDQRHGVLKCLDFSPLATGWTGAIGVEFRQHFRCSDVIWLTRVVGS